MSGAERKRMANAGRPEEGWSEASPWYQWGPYLSERAWAGVREDYSADGDAWASFPHDHARSRTYRWNEDGMAGITDVFNRLCLGLALWNGKDPILKERMFGLTNSEGNHGEDVKEYWWFLDALPSSAWLRWRYHYPQAAYPYEDLIEENGRRSRLEPEYELIDTGIFDDDRYWIVEVHYAKASPTDILMRVVVRNRGAEAATLHVLPHLWFRNEWSFDSSVERPELEASADGSAILASHDLLGDYTLHVGPAPDGSRPELVFCENETNGRANLRQPAATTPFPKDGINDHVVGGRPRSTRPGPGRRPPPGTSSTVGAGQSVELRLRLTRSPTNQRRSKRRRRRGLKGGRWPARQRDSTRSCASGRPRPTSSTRTSAGRMARTRNCWSCARRSPACSGASSTTATTWAAGWTAIRASPPPPPGANMGRNADWRHFDAADILSMPDPWEYPWFAAWDLAFHAITLAHIDPAFAKYQLLVLCREWFQHPNGALPAYEWSFDDVNPPVHAAAALLVWDIDGRQDMEFLKRIFHKLLMNFTWWLNREDMEGNDLFAGGFLGLDNIGAFDRSHIPAGTQLEQSDATAWMFLYCNNMLRIATVLAEVDPAYEDLMTSFLEHGVRISAAMNRSGLWDPVDGFFYDALKLEDGTSVPIKVHSMVGLIPVLPSAVVPLKIVRRGQALGKRFARFLEGLDVSDEIAAPGWLRQRPAGARVAADQRRAAGPPCLVAQGDAVRGRIPFCRMACGLCRSIISTIRSTSSIDGTSASVDYEPGESTSAMFGGNSNWRGPVWMPTNYLVIQSLRRLGRLVRTGLYRRISNRIGQAGPPAPRCRGHRPPPGRHLAGRRERTPAGLRLDREVPERPRLARPAAVPRVLPRRHRSRSRSVASDRLDWAGRPPAVSRRHPGSRSPRSGTRPPARTGSSIALRRRSLRPPLRPRNPASPGQPRLSRSGRHRG